MGYASVDIEALDSLLKTVREAGESITDDHTTIVDALAGGPVSSAPLAQAPEIAAWLSDQTPTLSNQLGYARWLDASTPGVQSTVSFEQAAVPELSEDQAHDLADEARELMEDGGPPSTRLLDLLETYGGNPQFALFLMDGYREGEGYATTDSGPKPDIDYIASLGEGATSERFLQLYSRALSGLSYEFDLPGAEDFPENGSPDRYRALSLLASRGEWNAQWLTQLGDDMIQAERADPELWTKDKYSVGNYEYENIATFTDPQGLRVDDPMVWLMDAMSRNPQAASDLFGGGGDAPIKSGGEEVDIAGNLRWLTLERPWDQDHGLSLSLALGAADSSGNADFTHDLDALKDLDPVEKASWYSFAAHLGLDIIGLVPVLGEWADGLNVSLSLAEGDYVGAGVSAAGAVPVFGSTATIGKWIKRLNEAADGAGAVLTADNLRRLVNELDLTDQDSSQRPGEGPGLSAVPPPDATHLSSTGDYSWYESRERLDPNRTYVLEGGLVIRTDAQGQVTEEAGDDSGIDFGERLWLNQHRATD